MPSSVAGTAEPTLLDRTSSPDFDGAVNSIVRRFGAARSEAEAIDHLAAAATHIGADSACFVSYVQEDELRAVYRYLMVGDPCWAGNHVERQHFAADPWLFHALNSTRVVRASELEPATAEQQATVDSAREAGMRSTMIVPAPPFRFGIRADVLYLGSATEGYFDVDEAFDAVKVVARGLAMEISSWLSRTTSEEIIARCHVTEADRVLLRFEQQGHGSKVIAAALGTEAKTIDCRFQRLNGKLGTANRRESLRIALLYEML